MADAFYNIALDGILKFNGMAPFGVVLERSTATAIRAYVTLRQRRQTAAGNAINFLRAFPSRMILSPTRPNVRASWAQRMVRVFGNYQVNYQPGESDGALLGGNSNWRGPVWMLVNYLLIESLRRFYQFYGDKLTLECPTGSGRMMTLDAIADELSRRILGLFQRGSDGRRPVFGSYEKFFPRRQRPRLRRLTPDRLDGIGCKHYRAACEEKNATSSERPADRNWVEPISKLPDIIDGL